MDWPFKNMVPGEVVVIWDLPPARVSMTAHNIGRYKGWTFRTRTVEVNGRTGVEVTRLAKAPKDQMVSTTQGTAGAAPAERLTQFGYEKLAVGESVTLTGDPVWLGKALSGVQSRERKYGMKLKRKSEIDPNTGQYAKLVITRIA